MRFLKHSVVVIGLIVGLTCFRGVSQAQTNPVLVFVRSGSLWQSDLSGGHEQLLTASATTNPPQSFYKPYASPDGQRLYFFNRSDTALWSVDLEETEPQVIVAKGVDATYGLTFSSDGTHLGVFVRQGLEHSFQVVTLDGELGRNYPLPIAMLGCGGGGYPPDQLVYDRQAGDQGNRLLLTWQEGRVLFSMNCHSIGVSVLDLATGTVELFDAHLNRPQISQDGQWLTGRMMADIPDAKPFGLLVIDSMTASTRQGHMDFDYRYDQWTWTADGEIVFIVVDVRDQTSVNARDPKLLEEIFGYSLEAPLDYHLVRLYRWKPGVSDPQLLYANTSWSGIPVLTTYENTLYFSAVDDLSSLVTGLESGLDREAIVQTLPQSHIYTLSLDEPNTPPVRILTNAEFPVVVVPNS